QSGVVAFTADHGENFGEHDVWFSHGGLYPSTLHVPLLLRWPGGPQRARSSAAVRQMDIGRTLLNLAGEEDSVYPGRDLRWGIDEPMASNPRFFLSAHGIEAAIEADGWLLNLSLANHNLMRSAIRRPLGRVELFHLAEDPRGEVDVLQANLPRAKKLRERLIEWLETAPAVGFASEGDSSPEMEALLTELGYAQADEPEAADWWRPDELDADWANNPWNVMFQDV
ncbi:MAG: sulfatase-like hydrolase/transferase, partial [Planctomycetota bacterium]